jgi:cellulose synthase/poly-beta-1,6-N-acetylglucosamine synthase-like glycosyltransferase
MISVVVPIYNEEENLLELRRRVAAALDSVPNESWELVLVNDGSRDDSLQIMPRNSRRSRSCGSRLWPGVLTRA